MQKITDAERMEIVLVSSGHTALDSRVFDKEAVSLAKYFPRVRVVATHAGDDMRANVRITGLPASTSRLERFLFRPLRCLLAARGTGRRVVIMHDAELLCWVPLLKLLTGWRIIYDVHEDFAQLLLRRSWIPGPLRRPACQAVALLEKAGSGCCDGIIGVTDVLVEKFHHKRRIALYNLPSRAFIEDAAARALPLAERQYDLVHLGTLSTERVEFLKAVLDSLFARKPDARVLLIGIRAEHREAFTSAYAPEQVTTLGHVSYQEVGALLANCRIGLNIHPVLYPHLRCAVPVKVFEYMAAGANVVTSFLPELHHLLGHEGMDHVTTIYTADAARFAGEIIRLLEHEALMVHHQQELLRLVSAQWHWEAEEEKFVEFVLGVIRGKAPAMDAPAHDHMRS